MIEVVGSSSWKEQRRPTFKSIGFLFFSFRSTDVFSKGFESEDLLRSIMICVSKVPMCLKLN